jgi:anti-repressor protein
MNIIPMNYEGQEIRTIIDESGDTMWVAKDVAVILGYKRPNDAIQQHCKGAAKHRPLQTPGGIQEVRVIHEPDLYRMIANSQLESAAKFEAWIFEVVLPSIRKNGGYIAGQEHTDDPALIMARALQVAQAVIDQKAAQLTAATKQIEEQAPKVDFHDTVAASTNSVLLGDFCKLLPGAGIMIGRNNFFAWLRSEKILNHKNLPYQLYLDKGWFSVRECTYENENSNGPRTAFTTKVTGKGQTGLIRRLKETDSYERFINKQAVSRAA